MTGPLSSLISLPGWHLLHFQPSSRRFFQFGRSLQMVFSEWEPTFTQALDLDTEILCGPASQKIHYLDVDGKLHINLVLKV